MQPATHRTHQGAATGAVVGGVAGVLLDRHNPWRGGVIGAAIGAVVGGTLTEISERGSREATEANQGVEYRTDDGRGVYTAQPEGDNPQTRCHTIRERVWEDGRLIKDRVKEICEETHAPAPPPVIVERRTVPPPPPVVVQERQVYVAPPPPSPGHPPWAPAHGRRGKHQYYYYPASYIYFDAHRGLYFYSRDDKWLVSRSLPRGVHVQKTDYVVLDMDTDSPYQFHGEVARKYPPAPPKNYRKGQKKREWDD